ncbi:MAG: porin [Ketobacteraceae bacterium]|nr:porin [Ketobacteraceae bacterium]
MNATPHFYPPQLAPHVLRWLPGAVVLLCSLLLTAGPNHALGFDSERFRLSGFATLGVASGGNDILGYRRNVAQPGQYDGEWSWEPDSLIGLQLDTSLAPSLDAAIQVVGKKRFNNSLENSIDWAYLRYRHSPGLTFRAGRIGMDLYMLSEYRNLGFSYLWAKPPMEFYGPTAFFYFEGADANYSFRLGEGTFNAKLFLGESENQFEFNGKGHEFKLNNLIGAVLGWESSHWRARFTFTSIDFDDDVNDVIGTELFRDPLTAAYQFGWTEAQAILEDIEVDDNGVNYYSVGLAYENSPWFLQGEISYLDSDYDVLKSYAGRYISAGYSVGATTFYTIVAKAKQTESRTTIGELPAFLANVPELIQLQEGVQSLYDRTYADQESLSFGLRWDIRYDTALKLQWDRTWVEPAGGVLWEQRETPEKTQTVNTYSINLNFIF